MLHATDARLRRLEDEPLAIPDRVAEHVERCPRCLGRLAAVTADARRCARFLAAPQPVPDVDSAWARLRRELRRTGERDAGSRGRVVSVPARSARRATVSLRHAFALGALVIVLGGTAAAATLTTVFAPTHVAPITLSESDVSALANLMGLGTQFTAGQGQAGSELGGFSTSSGSLTTSFGTFHWSSSGSPAVVSTRGAAEKAAGFLVSLPSRLPDGVAGPQQFVVQPRVEVTVKLDPSVANIGGSSVVLETGPAVLVEYGSASGPDVPTLGIMDMPRPTAVASGATMRQIEAFVLEQPGIPADLAQEIRVLGDLGTTLPVPVPAGAPTRSVQIAGSPGVLVADPSGAASGVLWEDSSGALHAVAGLLDQQDVLDVAEQLG